jgi:sulfur carrier protein
MIRVNGEPSEVPPGTTVAELLSHRGAPDRGVAVAVDGEVVPRTQWDSTALQDETAVEIVMAVQGG